MRTRGWHGYYWARPTPSGDYELRSVPTSLGEPPVNAGIAPREAFEKLYEPVDAP